MAVDLEAIRRRVQELSGNRRNSSVQLWKPEPGDYKVRCVPWKQTVDGMPFIERRFYYLGNSPRILAPAQFGKPDPVNDLIRKLYSTKSPADRELAKKLQPKMTSYVSIIVRGQEDKGLQVWSFNKFIYQRLLDFYTNADVNPDLVDYMDPLEGIDLLVNVKKSGKKFNDREMLDFTIDLGRKQSKLSNDADQAKKWLDALPNIDDMYPQKSVQEIETALNNWLNGDAVADTSTDGTSKGSASSDALDALVQEVKAESKPAEAKTDKVSKPAKAKKPSVDDDEAPVEKKSLDDAFADLMKDDE